MQCGVAVLLRERLFRACPYRAYKLIAHHQKWLLENARLATRDTATVGVDRTLKGFLVQA
jgi:hypothetical protein